VWLAKLLGFDYEIEFKKGKDNVVVDALLRVTCGTLSTITVSSLSTILLAAIKESWQKDKDVQLLIQELTLQPNSHPHYSWVNQLLCRKGKLVVGQLGPFQTQIISLYHDSATGGHSGTTVTAKRVANGFIGRANKSMFDNTSGNAPFANKTNLKTHALLGYYNPSLYLQLLSLILVWTSWRGSLNLKDGRLSLWLWTYLANMHTSWLFHTLILPVL
jgi:hypothetical protein